jgi:CubicO group peptidase (beta-lactamase class C family)
MILRRLGLAVLAGALLLALMAAAYRQELVRVVNVIMLFDQDVIVENFRSMESIFDVAIVRRGSYTHQFERELQSLSLTYEYKGQTKSIADFLERTWTTGLVAILDGKIVYENYYRGNTDASKTISWSVAKSFVSALVGIAVEEGRIRDIHDSVSDYVPQLRGTGYDGISIKEVLQMSSGIKFNEDYGDFWSDINRLGRAIAFNTSLDEFVRTLERERTPGTYNHYVSMDTQVLGMLLREATGQSLTSYLESRIWKPLGMESDAHWLVDKNGMELAFGGLNAVLRDYARFGLLYLNEGQWGDAQIVPANWVRASVTPDAPHLQPGVNAASSWVLGYGYQWWIPQRPDGDYLAIGIYNQFIYVYPRYKTVIAKSSAYPWYNVDGNDKELETIAVFRAITKHLAKSRNGIE